VRFIICSSVLAAVVAAAQYGLRQLANSVDLSSFMLFCIAAVAIEVALAFAWDHVERIRRR